ncbi:ARM repeat-containing protein [Viridothelium virens]|uniref:ARM repeat-containing protein n=1 Tax=Viridothelium virens TaxID=1048519 RepID=A0A6A6H9D5_VIRVR|nr:ARM repeat-containing protein [Viridothelium virens]
MNGLKRKSLASSKSQSGSKDFKKLKVTAAKGVSSPLKVNSSSKTQAKKEEAKEEIDSDGLVESDTTEDENGFGGFSASEAREETTITDLDSAEENGEAALPDRKSSNSDGNQSKVRGLQEGQTSKEAHAKQKALAKERKLAKPNADSIQRSKKLWERLRRKSHVPKQEREQLVSELYEIITGRIKDFVFKHDSVRVVQCALKYANMRQRKMIATELKGEYKTLAENRYAKFLIGKLLVEGDAEIRDIIIPEFYGHVRRMINHPEASWIVDDIYRQVATSKQKALLLREWYGAEFSLFKNPIATATENPTPELSAILASAPEKRKPIMSYLFHMINQLIQKRMTGFTMLHDAMLQYFLNISAASEEYVAFTDLLRPDSSDESDGTPDLLENLAFTSSGSRLLCLLLAQSSAKDRRAFLKVFKDNIQLMAYDSHAHTILLTAYTVVDDTREIAKTILPELVGAKLGDTSPPDSALDNIFQVATHLVARRTLLWPLGSTSNSKVLLSPPLQTLLNDVRRMSIDTGTSKKQPDIRTAELSHALLPHLLATVANRAADLLASGFGAQFISDVLLSSHIDAVAKRPAAEAVAGLAAGDLTESDHPFCDERPWAGRMLKMLVLGGSYDAEAGRVARSENWAEVRFPGLVWKSVKGKIVKWACGGSSFVVVNLLDVEEEDGGLIEEEKTELLAELRKGKGALEETAGDAEKAEVGKKKGKKQKKGENGEQLEGKGKARGNVGAKMLLEKLR